MTDERDKLVMWFEAECKRRGVGVMELLDQIIADNLAPDGDASVGGGSGVPVTTSDKAGSDALPAAPADGPVRDPRDFGWDDWKRGNADPPDGDVPAGQAFTEPPDPVLLRRYVESVVRGATGQTLDEYLAEPPADTHPHDVDLRTVSTAEELARFFHETYEKLAPGYGYKTREASAVPWNEVPYQNRSLMMDVAWQALLWLNERLSTGSAPGDDA